MCSVSGGYDSDIVLDLVIRCGGRAKTTFVFNDTGLEYDATKEHLMRLKERYGIQIKRLFPQKAIPSCCRDYGVPFWSKYVSSMIYRLQKHWFQWEDKPLEVLLDRYPGCRSALRWWCNDFKTANGRESRFNIAYVKGLKEFIRQNPPDFRISAKCCEYSKKVPAHKELLIGDYDLNITGIRKKRVEHGAAPINRVMTRFFVAPTTTVQSFGGEMRKKRHIGNGPESSGQTATNCGV